MESTNQKNNIQEVIAIILGVIGISVFLVYTNFIWNPLLLFIIIIFILHPFRRESPLVKRLILLSIIIFIIWLLKIIWTALIPFFVAFLITYLLDPIITFLNKKKIPRWVSSAVAVLLIIGIISSVAIFVFPLIFNQLNSVINKISSLLASVSSFFNSKSFDRSLSKFGFMEEEIKSMIHNEFVPTIENYLNGIMESLLRLMTSVSGIATQILNVILTPILTFYFLKDFSKLRELINNTVEKRDPKLLSDLKRINKIFQIYVGWQVLEAIIVGTLCSISFALLGIPFPFVLGMICGFMNPIPYLGIFASMLICMATVVVINPENLWQQILIIASVISAIHFLNAYLLEPNIVGKKVGVHPLILIASLFVFGYLFGFLGLFVAVPTTAALVMFFNDWRQSSVANIEVVK